MGKPIVERMRKPEYWYADQLPHWAIGLAIAAVITNSLAFTGTLSPALSIWLGVLVSWAIGIGRELVQNWGDAPNEGSVEDTQVDMVFWTMGAFMGALPAVWA